MANVFTRTELRPMRQAYWVSCQHTIYRPGERPYVCGSPTEKGSHVCDRCVKLERKGAGTQRRDSIKTYL